MHLQALQEAGGEYIPTAKNHMVENHYPGLGFNAMDSPGYPLYELHVGDYDMKECYIDKK